MMESKTDTSPKSSKRTLDLSALSELDFGPSWADKDAEKKSLKVSPGQESRSKHSGSGGKRDRRPPGKGYKGDKAHSGERNTGEWNSSERNSSQRNTGERNTGERKTFQKEGRRDGYQPKRDPFQPTVDVNIYPQDESFEALIKRLRSTVRTYQLFEIANLILEKPERYVIALQNKSQNNEKPEPLYYAVPDNLPFETEDAVINHVLNSHLESFFDVEAIEVEPPKGNFQVVNRCSITGELLGPPNYHRYQEFLQRHYASRINNMSFDHFVSKIESVKEQESIDAWIESMKQGARYTLKDPKEGEPTTFESLETVRSFLLQNRKDAVIGSNGTVRFAGRDVKDLPKGTIRRSIEIYIEQQLRFPLDTANNIRGRLRRHNFTVYKKGSKGISYVCAVKRKFRDDTTKFTSSIQEVIDFVEKNPDVLASKLPELYLGIDTEKQQAAKLEISESEGAEKQMDVQSEAPDTANAEANADQTAEAVETSPQEQSAADSSIGEALPPSGLSEEDSKKLKGLMLDLRWLVTEGYVTEYGDGRLFAPPPAPKPKETKKPATTETGKKAEADENTAAEAPEAALPFEETPDKVPVTADTSEG